MHVATRPAGPSNARTTPVPPVPSRPAPLAMLRQLRSLPPLQTCARALMQACIAQERGASSAAAAGLPSATRPPLPPFTEDTARQKVQAAEDAWNSRDADRVALAYTEDSEWRNRAEFIKGRDQIREFLRRKWAREQGYVLRKYLWAHSGNRIAVCFEYEWHDDSGQWFRAYGNENWEFSPDGLMRKRIASINEAPITPSQRRIAVDPGASVPANPWLGQQGLSSDEQQQAGGGGSSGFPLGGGSAACY